jgi:hypothetical protein
VADITPGLIPTRITRTPGLIASVSRRFAQTGLESLAMNWLFKEEPSNYDYDALARDGKTSWTGVRNPVAQRNLRSIKKGDKIFFYHTGNEKAVIGICRAAGGTGEKAEGAGHAGGDQGGQAVRDVRAYSRSPAFRDARFRRGVEADSGDG